MPQLLFDNVTIERYRGIRRLELDELGQVNLITGRNNTGKSSILEALQVLASNASAPVLRGIMNYREEGLLRTEDLPTDMAEGFAYALSSFFTGFPPIGADEAGFVVSSIGRKGASSLALSARVASAQREPDGGSGLRLIPEQDRIEESTAVPVLVVEIDGETRLIPFESLLQRPGRLRFYPRQVAGDRVGVPCRYVSPYGGERTGSLAALWDTVALSDEEREVVAALQIIDPGIVALSMVGGDGGRQQRTAIVRSKDFERPVPLRTYGDGVNRLLGIVLALVSARDGLLLIDEFENGLHHSVQLDLWRVIFRLARRLSIQVFATTHSWDAIAAFQEASAESADEGVLIRLTRKGDSVFPSVFGEKQLALATRKHIEVR